MNALVPAGTNLARVYSGVKRARTATGYVRTYGPTAMRAARTIARAYRRRRRRRAPGKRVMSGRQGTTRSKMTANTDFQILANKTLRVIPVEFGTMGDQYGDRTGHTVNMRGLKFCFEFQNEGQRPLIVHFAIMQLREEPENVQQYDMKSNFFRDFESQTRRDKDFEDGAPYDWRYECYGLNPSKFNILMHKKKTLIGRSAGATEGGNPRNEVNTGRMHFRWHFKRYIKIRKHLSFSTRISQTPTKPLFYVFWSNSISGDDYTGSTPISWCYMSKPVWRNALN